MPVTVPWKPIRASKKTKRLKYLYNTPQQNLGSISGYPLSQVCDVVYSFIMTQHPPLYPPALKKGDKIGIFSTSCSVPESDIITAKKFIEGQGYEAYIHPQCFNQLHQSAGTAREKTDALHDLFSDLSIKAIIGSRGGNRASTMLDKIDFELIKQNPKIFMGYSDLTILLNSIYQRTGLVTFHGPLFRELPTHQDCEDMMNTLSGQNNEVDLGACKILKSGDAQGTLLGGNLSVFQGLIGTSYMPDVKNAILILEDVGDHLSRYDRMFCHLKNAGILNQLSALIMGSFSDTKDSDNRPFGFTLEDIILEHTDGLNIPILMNAPFGHEGIMKTMPIGANSTLKNGKLSFKPLA